MKAARTDANQAAIVDALRKVGASVQTLHTVGGGVPDLLVWRGDYYLLEVKDGSKPKSAQKLTPEQVAFHKRFPVQVVNSVESALAAIGVNDGNA